MFIDAHAHLTGQENPELSDLLARALQAGVKAILNVCCDEQDLMRGLALAANSSFPKIYTIAAITPHDAAKDRAKFFSLIKQSSEVGALIAIGETGLDYHYLHAPKEKQQESLRMHFQLANSMKLPVVIHCRDAFVDLFAILDEESKLCCSPPRVMLHCFTGGIKEAELALERGWYISISGCVTFPKSLALQEVVSIVPLDKLLIETDSPYLAPQGYRGRTNEPAFIVATAKIISSIKKIPLELLADQTASNAALLFELGGC